MRPITTLLSSSQTSSCKDGFIRQCRSFNKTHKDNKLNTTHLKLPGTSKPIFIDESLTSTGRRLAFLARQCVKDNNYHSTCISYGKIYIKKSQDSSVLRINCEQDLQKIRPKWLFQLVFQLYHLLFPVVFFVTLLNLLKPLQISNITHTYTQSSYLNLHVPCRTLIRIIYLHPTAIICYLQKISQINTLRFLGSVDALNIQPLLAFILLIVSIVHLLNSPADGVFIIIRLTVI